MVDYIRACSPVLKNLFFIDNKNYNRSSGERRNCYLSDDNVTHRYLAKHGKDGLMSSVEIDLSYDYKQTSEVILPTVFSMLIVSMRLFKQHLILIKSSSRDNR